VRSFAFPWPLFLPGNKCFVEMTENHLIELATLQIDVDTLGVRHVYRPHLKIGQAAHFLHEPAPAAESTQKTTESMTGSPAEPTTLREKTTESSGSKGSNSINYRFRFDWLRLGSFYIEEKELPHNKKLFDIGLN